MYASVTSNLCVYATITFQFLVQYRPKYCRFRNNRYISTRESIQSCQGSIHQLFQGNGGYQFFRGGGGESKLHVHWGSGSMPFLQAKVLNVINGCEWSKITSAYVAVRPLQSHSDVLFVIEGISFLCVEGYSRIRNGNILKPRYLSAGHHGLEPMCSSMHASFKLP